MVTQRRVYQCLSALTFFGLTQPYRLSVFSQIHEIVFHGKGGYTWTDVYNMPLWLRKFTFEKIKEFYEKEKDEKEDVAVEKDDVEDMNKTLIFVSDQYDEMSECYQ